LYHVGFLGLFYRFFFRDNVQGRIWKDLFNGVEVTPTYGLDFSQSGGGRAGNNNNNMTTTTTTMTYACAGGRP